MKSHKCIWCLGEAGGRHIEHIIPEVLGCPPAFVLSADVICLSCNNDLAHLDKAVADDFDFHSFLAGVPRKRGRPPTIASRGNVLGDVRTEGPEIIFNMNAEPMFHRRKTVAGYRGTERSIKANWHAVGDEGGVSFEITFGKSKKFQRGIYKIALSALIYFIGEAELYKSKYDVLRQYVRNGTGTRRLMIMAEADPNKYRHEFGPPYVSASGDYSLEFRLACARFFVDLSEDERYLTQLANLAEQEMGSAGWTVVPI